MLREYRCMRRSIGALVLGSLCFLPRGVEADLIDVEFEIDGIRSNIEIVASSLVFNSTRTDVDSAPYLGTIQAQVDSDLLFRPTAELNLLGAQAEAVGGFDDYRYVFSDVDGTKLDDVIGEFTTTSPPVEMQGLPTGLIRFDFSMSEFPFALSTGTAQYNSVLTVDLASDPLTGPPPSDLRGQLTVLNIDSSGSTTIDAELFLPIEFTDEIAFDATRTVSYQASGAIYANATFSVPEPAVAAFFCWGFVVVLLLKRQLVG